jgi:hypothetical protein
MANYAWSKIIGDTDTLSQDLDPKAAGNAQRGRLHSGLQQLEGRALDSKLQYSEAVSGRLNCRSAIRQRPRLCALWR